MTSDLNRQAQAIRHELDTRTSRLAATMHDEFNQDDAQSVTTKDFHEMVRRNWSDPTWRIQTAQRIGPVPLFKAALDAFGLNMDGTTSIDSHPDAIAATPPPTALQQPAPQPPAPTQPMPNVFPQATQPPPAPPLNFSPIGQSPGAPAQ